DFGFKISRSNTEKLMLKYLSIFIEGIFMWKYLTKWTCISLGIIGIIGCSNQEIKEETKNVLHNSKSQIQNQKKETKDKSNLIQEKKGLQDSIGAGIKEVKWYVSLEKGLKVAIKENKLLMVDFTAEWCGWCKKLDNTTYQNPNVLSLSRNFISVKVDCDRYPAVARKYNVGGLPTIVFMNQNGQIIYQVVGYRVPEDFVKEMRKALEISN
ncbi:MAG: thioredoxin family protein, partial [bacterium]|nr:thioredoxin family protein [bacterium]